MHGPDLTNDRVVAATHFPDVVHIGRGTYWSATTEFLTYTPEERIHIGRYCSIAEEVNISSGGDHHSTQVSTWPFENLLLGLDNPTRSYRPKRDTSVGSDVWIGRGARVLGGCAIGDGAIIGAHAVVRGNVPPYAIVVGNPGRVVRYRFEPTIRDALLAVSWWDWPPELIRERMEWFYMPAPNFIAECGLPLKARLPFFKSLRQLLR